MHVEISCPNCRKQYKVLEKHIGRNVVCAASDCGTKFVATMESLRVEIVAETSDHNTATDTLDRESSLATSGCKYTAEQDTHESSNISASVSANPETSGENVSTQEATPTSIAEATQQNQTQFWGMAKKLITDASTSVTGAGVAVTTKAVSLGSSGVSKAAEVGRQTYVSATSAIDATGAKEVLKATTSVVSNKLDEVSGKRLVELLEKKLQLQDTYNDVLATRLAEALERIKTLEDRVNRLDPQSSSEPVFKRRSSSEN